MLLNLLNCPEKAPKVAAAKQGRLSMTDVLWFVPVLKILFFVAASLPIIYISRASLKKPGSHGFFRFIAWEAILALVMLNLDVWFVDLFSWHQLISWLFLLVSVFLLIQGVRLLKEFGQPDSGRADPTLLGFEKTTRLVTTGIYGYIRHPLYSSLMFLAWGTFFKDINITGGILVLISTVFLIATARADEAECLRYFGSDYAEYRKRTKMFIPYLF
jgi:protein-S-isoprenylcysteine O-methyltransferase Ste14